MKLSIGKRILMFFHWLFSLVICAGVAAYVIKPDEVTAIYNRVTGRLTPTEVMVIGIAALAVYVVLCVIQLCIIFHRGKRADRGFITMDSSDAGRVRIAVTAIEQMVRQSVTSIDGINEMKIDIESMDDAIGINIAATLQNGCHVPTVTMNMQQAIRRFVEVNCGVAVRSVSININGVSSVPEPKGRWGRKPHAEVPPTPQTPPTYAPAFEPAPAAPAVEPEPVAAPEPVAEPEPVAAPEPVTEPEPVAVPDPVPAEPEPAYDLPERGPIKLTLDYSPAYSDGEDMDEAPAAVEEDN